MAGDYTRFRYNPLKDTSGVLMEQGRVLVDQDLNQYVQLIDRRWRAETMDIIGRAVFPSDTPNAFQILIGGATFTIGIGRMYVDGLMGENHGLDPTAPTKRTYDPILGELVGNLPISYEQQPYFPNPPAPPADGKPHLVYLDLHERELTYIEEPDIIDKAVAVDTCTLIQTVWQVKVLDDTPAGTDCSTPPGGIPAWVAATAPSAGQLTTAAAGAPSSADPCIVPTAGGYRGAGNRCYRVEIHTAGAPGTATFKWSRDNASVASAVTAINAALDTLTVVLTRRDTVLRFQPNDWVEVTDEFRYFQGLPGEMHQVASVDDVNRTIQLKTPLTAGLFDATKPERRTRVIRWDQKGIVRDPLNTPIVDLDLSGGLIPVPAAGTTIVLEDGIQVTFSIDATLPVGAFRALDHWVFSARVVDASVEILTKAPPRGILHHYAWLGFITLPGGPATDCRIPWPPKMADCCDCTVCVTPASHNGGTRTLQWAVNKVQPTGGKICLAPGRYFITSPVKIQKANNIEFSGHGLPNLIAVGLSKDQPMFQIEDCWDINIGDIAFVGPERPGKAPVNAVVISRSLFTRINRCLFTGFLATFPGGVESTMARGVGLSEFVWNNQVRDCLFYNVQVGIGFPTAEFAKTPFIAFSAAHDNEFVCLEAGLAFADTKFPPNFLDVSFADNFVASPVGFNFHGNGLDIEIERNTFFVTPGSTAASAFSLSAAVLCNASQTRIANNQMYGGPNSPGANGIVLDVRALYGTQIVGNRMDTLGGCGVLIRKRTILLETSISENQLLNIGATGIRMENFSYALDLNITGNSFAFVGMTAATPAFAMSGITLSLSFNLNVNDNVIEVVGPNAALTGSRA